MIVFELLQVWAIASDVFIDEFDQVSLELRQHTMTNGIVSRNFAFALNAADHKMLGKVF